MVMQSILEDVLKIEPDNLFLNYIIERVQDDDYRGMHVSQHNRYDLDRVIKILKGIHDVAGKEIFRVPLGDDDGVKEAECERYYCIVKKVNEYSGIGTINSLKKNFFVDFQKMGLLDRYDEKEILLPKDKKGHVYYARLTDIAERLVTSGSIAEQYKIFTDSLDKLFSEEITKLAETLYYSKYKNDPIGILEFMLILSDDRPGLKYDKIELINSFRELKRYQQEKAIDLIKQYCNPDNFEGDKIKKRDFGNWKNESQQIFSLLKNTVYFDITQNSIRLNTGRYGIFEEAQVKQRSLGAKQEYFKRHMIKDKIPTFELHHIIPFSSARNKEEFALIDNWENLVYLRKDKHAELTKSKDRNMVLYATSKQLDFDDFYKKRVTARNGSTVVYKGDLASSMERYNREILKEVFNYET